MKILLVKLSSLGDVVHALPVVQDIHAALPDAQIDWVVEKTFAPLVQSCPGVRRVIPCELRRWRKAPLSAVTRQEWSAFKAQLRDQAYDAVIDLQGLAKSALVARLARMAPEGKRFALANQTEGSGYEAPSRWVADVAIRLEPRIHAVQRSRELASRSLGYPLAVAVDFGLKVPPALVIKGLPAIDLVAGRVLFVHGTSRADKEWPMGHWVELGQRLMASGQRIAVLHGNAGELATSQAMVAALNSAAALAGVYSPASMSTSISAAIKPASAAAIVLPSLSLDEVLAALAGSAGVIGVDSGVSHIAVALNLPHVQIYNFDTAWRTGPGSMTAAAQGFDDAAVTSSSRQTSVFAQPTPGVEAVWQAWQGVSKAAR